MIHKLPIHIANQIAAGEVVQRPESVVKELVENAIDAGADSVAIHISKAGKNSIQIIDNGGGMTEEDALLAFERHATSKLQNFDDLERLVTFGFRGEALPSIASVAKVELKTRTEAEELATLIRIEGGALVEQTKTEAPVGTSITVKNLFYNTPARRQFLKTDQTEYRHIADTVQRYILSNPNVHFRFVSEGSPVYDIPAELLRTRVKHLFGDRVAESLIEVNEETDVLSVNGFVGRPDFAKKSRGDQFLFVNGRYITSRLLNHAVYSTYEHMLDHGEYPMYILFLNINPAEVDVNVHPSKLEVKFSNEKNIYTLLNTIVRQSLFRHDLVPSMRFRDEEDTGPFSRVRMESPAEQQVRPDTQRDYSQSGFRQSGGGTDAPYPRREVSTGNPMDRESIEQLFQSLEGAYKPTESAGQESSSPDETVIYQSERPASESGLIWQFHNKYIFTTIKSGLMIIDQHVAHERILYEKALTLFENASPFSQQLLFAHKFRVTPSDYSLVEELLPDLKAMGFIVTLSPPNFVQVEAVPQDVRAGMEERILEEMIEQYREYGRAGESGERHKLAASYGCKAAIKAGDPLNAPEMQHLIDELFATRNPYVCPHGRPVVIKLSLSDIDRKFGRTS
ncbi:MAG: DNA mismatch repair protein MutL [Ectothiorhodospiraceae bacterium]|nr:DNA mismatch repair protein MutL [Ectothiorhodospiraceae bacterium]